MNTSTDITFEEAGNILLNVSKWKNADMHTVEVSYDSMLNLKQRYILLKVLFECFSKWVITNNVFFFCLFPNY